MVTASILFRKNELSILSYRELLRVRTVNASLRVLRISFRLDMPDGVEGNYSREKGEKEENPRDDGKPQGYSSHRNDNRQF